MLVHIPATGYVTLPWKNGTGQTDEIYLSPEGADRNAFDLRISRATISGPGLFSAFPGADRTITLIEGRGLSLEFPGRKVKLAPLAPFAFDSGLTPDGVPDGGPVKVLNVMAARSVWRIGRADVLGAPATMHSAALWVVFAARGAWHAATPSRTITLAPGDTALCSAGADLNPVGQGAALVVPLTRVTSDDHAPAAP